MWLYGLDGDNYFYFYPLLCILYSRVYFFLVFHSYSSLHYPSFNRTIPSAGYEPAIQLCEQLKASWLLSSTFGTLYGLLPGNPKSFSSVNGSCFSLRDLWSCQFVFSMSCVLMWSELQLPLSASRESSINLLWISVLSSSVRQKGCVFSSIVTVLKKINKCQGSMSLVFQLLDFTTLKICDIKMTRNSPVRKILIPLRRWSVM